MLFTKSTLYVSSHFFGFSRQAYALLLTFSVTIISSLFSHFNDSDIGECTSENSLLNSQILKFTICLKKSTDEIT